MRILPVMEIRRPWQISITRFRGVDRSPGGKKVDSYHFSSPGLFVLNPYRGCFWKHDLKRPPEVSVFALLYIALRWGRVVKYQKSIGTWLDQAKSVLPGPTAPSIGKIDLEPTARFLPNLHLSPFMQRKEDRVFGCRTTENISLLHHDDA